ncbi:MAG: FKBP-type peptidyl-prolyl cis-trans isomerase [Prevotella sp.]|nr:FKBP-type peptidyl-prolyl cis-trans isomerase [Prevotella sp.]MBQ9644875.1 FKBP-type peptidyl-prolyl cis-trans isomerase [Prevotella sp.]
MKKISFVATMAIAAATMISCDGNAPQANMKSDVDSFSYALGMAQTQGLKPYLSERMGVDTTYLADFIKGVNEGANAGDNKKKAAYFAGIQIGQQIANQMVKGYNFELFGEDSTKTISLKNLLAGLVSGVSGRGGKMTIEEADSLAQALMTQIKASRFEENKKKGEQFLAENAKKEGVKTTPSGLQYKVLKEGNGAMPTDTSTVMVNYEGRLVDGTVFDASNKYGDKPAQFRVNQVIKGWTEALKMMPVGSQWEIYIPQELAYGAQGQRGIDPMSALIFKVELVEIK